MRFVGARGVLVAVVGLMAGCWEITNAQKVEDVCNAFCSCLVPISQFDECVQECPSDIAPVSDPCVDCVYGNSHTCSALETECFDLCVPNP